MRTISQQRASNMPTLFPAPVELSRAQQLGWGQPETHWTANFSIFHEYESKLFIEQLRRGRMGHWAAGPPSFWPHTVPGTPSTRPGAQRRREILFHGYLSWRMLLFWSFLHFSGLWHACLPGAFCQSLCGRLPTPMCIQYPRVLIPRVWVEKCSSSWKIYNCKIQNRKRVPFEEREEAIYQIHLGLHLKAWWVSWRGDDKNN